jgi:type II secretory pathway pseudopilin PulG
MFKHIVIVAIASLIVGCSFNPFNSEVERAKQPVNGLKNYNVVQDASVKMGGRELNFVTFEKTVEVLVIQNGQTVTDTQSRYGSGVQWNEDYVVTTKNVDFADGSVQPCIKDCEIQFIKRKATAPVPDWRSHVVNERITFVGIESEARFRAEFGMDLNVKTYTETNTGTLLNVADNQIVNGMSGGPAYGLDGKVVGILTGSTETINLRNSTNRNLSGRGEHLSVYLSYEDVQKEWEKFQQSH